MLDHYLPESSSLIIHSSDSWLRFIKHRKSNKNLDGTYLPRTLTAHLKEDTPYFEINKFHEYYGHGGFCEHSQIGDRIVQYELELKEIEKQIIGSDKFQDNSSFKLSKNHQQFNQYVTLRKEFDNYFNQHHNYYEGYAYWLEKYFSLESGLGELYQIRERTFIEPFYLQLVASFNDFVKKNSINALLDKMGFLV